MINTWNLEVLHKMTGTKSKLTILSLINLQYKIYFDHVLQLIFKNKIINLLN